MNSIEKACRITSKFEGKGGFSGLAGDFDGQGISFGFLQFNAGQGSLHTLLSNCYLHMPGTMAEIFGHKNAELLQACKTPASLLAFGRSISRAHGRMLADPWHKMFIQLGQTPGCQKLQMNLAQKYIKTAHRIMAAYGYKSERAYCLCFDIAVQNGSVVQEAREFYRAHVKAGMTEREKLKVLAQAVAKGAIDRWESDVLSRKKAIVDGAGRVHGEPVKFDLSDGPMQL